MNVLWLLGTFTFATVIGIIGEDVTNTIMVSALPMQRQEAAPAGICHPRSNLHYAFWWRSLACMHLTAKITQALLEQGRGILQDPDCAVFPASW